MWDETMGLAELHEVLADIERFAARCPDGPECKGCAYEREEVLSRIAEIQS